MRSSDGKRTAAVDFGSLSEDTLLAEAVSQTSNLAGDARPETSEVLRQYLCRLRKSHRIPCQPCRALRLPKSHGAPCWPCRILRLRKSFRRYPAGGSGQSDHQRAGEARPETSEVLRQYLCRLRKSHRIPCQPCRALRLPKSHGAPCWPCRILRLRKSFRRYPAGGSGQSDHQRAGEARPETSEVLRRTLCPAEKSGSWPASTTTCTIVATTGKTSSSTGRTTGSSCAVCTITSRPPRRCTRP